MKFSRFKWLLVGRSQKGICQLDYFFLSYLKTLNVKKDKKIALQCRASKLKAGTKMGAMLRQS